MFYIVGFVAASKCSKKNLDSRFVASNPANVKW
jgi:hypothetical protein